MVEVSLAGAGVAGDGVVENGAMAESVAAESVGLEGLGAATLFFAPLLLPPSLPMACHPVSAAALSMVTIWTLASLHERRSLVSDVLLSLRDDRLEQSVTFDWPMYLMASNAAFAIAESLRIDSVVTLKHGHLHLGPNLCSPFHIYNL
jgi:hypothetical protein